MADTTGATDRRTPAEQRQANIDFAIAERARAVVRLAEARDEASENEAAQDIAAAEMYLARLGA